MDIRCICGELGHIDEDFTYFIICSKCNANPHVELILLTEQEVAKSAINNRLAKYTFFAVLGLSQKADLHRAILAEPNYAVHLMLSLVSLVAPLCNGTDVAHPK